VLIVNRVLTICLLCFSATSLLSADKIYVDQAHNNQFAVSPSLGSIAKSLSLDVGKSAEPITTEALREVRILYVRGSKKKFSESEMKAIGVFVRSGGSLLVGLDEERRFKLQDSGMNELLHPFGMMLTQDTPYLHNCGALSVPGEVSSKAWEIAFSGGRSVAGGTSFAHQLDKRGEPGLPSAAWKKLEGGGKIVVLSELMPTLYLGQKDAERLSGEIRNPRKTTYWGGDSVRFMTEVFEWLAN